MQGHYKHVECWLFSQYQNNLILFLKKRKKNDSLYSLNQIFKYFTAGLFYSFPECLGANSVQISSKSYPIRLVQSGFLVQLSFIVPEEGCLTRYLRAGTLQLSCAEESTWVNLWKCRFLILRVWFWRLEMAHKSLHFNKLRRSSLAIIKAEVRRRVCWETLSTPSWIMYQF